MSKIIAAEHGKSAVQPGSFRLSVTGPDIRHPTIHVINSPFALIGRARGCSLRLDHPAVSRRHIYLQAVLGRMYYLDLSSRGEGLSVEGPRNADWLEPDEVIGVGPYEVRLVDTMDLDCGSKQPPPGFSPLDRYSGQLGPMPKVNLEFFRGAALQTNATVTRLVTLGGSSAKCKYRLQDKSVSSVHFSFLLTHNGLCVVDLAGRTGTVVNDRPVVCEILSDRDTLRVGTFLIRVHHSGENLGDRPAIFHPQEVDARPQTVALAAHFPNEQFCVDEVVRIDESLRELQAPPLEAQAESDRITQEQETLEQAAPDTETLRFDAERVQQAEVDKLRDEVRSERMILSVMRDELEAERAALNGEWRSLDSARNQLADVVQARAELEEELRRVGEERQALDQERNQLAANASVLESQQAALNRSQDQIEALQTELVRRDEALRAEEQEFGRRQEMLAADEARLAAHNEAIEAEQQSFARLRTEIESKLAAAERERRESEAERVRLADFQTAVQREREAVGQDWIALETRRAELERREAEQGETGRNLAEELEKLACRRRQTDETAARTNAEWAALEDDRRQFESERGVMQAAGANLAKARADLESNRAALRGQCDLHDAAAKALAMQRDEFDLLRTSLSADQDKLDCLRSLVEAQRESLDAERSALEADREQISNAELRTLAQSRELEAAKFALDTERTSLNQRVAEIEREHADMARERRQIENERVHAEAAREALQAELAELVLLRESIARQQAETESLAAQRRLLAVQQDRFKSDTSKQELEKIQGIWTLVSVEADGWEVADEVIKRQRFIWVIRGDRITHRPETGLRRESSFQLDLTKTPNEIVVRPVDGRSKRPPKRGIYSLGSDYLKVCVSKNEDQLPTAFATKVGDGLRILVFRRQTR